MSRRIEIYDTTLRDGSQGEGVSFSLEDKLLIARRLLELGFDYVEGGYPLSNDKDAQFFQKATRDPAGKERLAAFGMTRRKGVAPADDPGMKALVESGTDVITIVGKTSDFHVTEVLRATLDENLEMIADTVGYLRQTGRKVIYDAEHFFDGWKANRDYALKAVKAAADAGAALIVLCDTNGGSMPEEVAEMTRAVSSVLAVPVGIHCHNDCELAVANSLAAVDAGAVQVQGTINGIGERCGNADLISVIANLAFKKRGYEVLRPESLPRLTELSRYVYELANMNFRPNQAFVGQSAFAHKGGMHVHAVARAASSYEHMAPERVGNERRFLVSELSGRSNIMALTAKHKLEHDRGLMDKILARVVAMENQGYQFEAAEGSFDLLVRRCAGTYRPHFERLNFHVTVEADGDDELTTEATVKLRVGGTVRHEVAEGDGPVNALDAALRKALTATFPGLASMHLVDYKVRVINSEAATAAGVRVVIESRDEHDVWGTVGVSENIIEASWIALADSIEYKLYKDELSSGSSMLSKSAATSSETSGMTRDWTASPVT
ncbi:MAG: citramalate synthase [Planctomycetia bacterium 21-64-5]|nr:MAG: citramalate synthase [Planctomycetia bacterium 21-64-5]HQU42103.1 citramalate synthase [Pirellulales bacterium]